MSRVYSSLEEGYNPLANNQLKKKLNSQLCNILTDLSDGVWLIQLLEILGNESLGRYNLNPVLRIQKIENLNKALEFIRARGVNLTNIGAEDILDFNSKLTLGLVWMLILRFSIDEIRDEGLTAKDALLAWCRRKTFGYKDVDVKDFAYSWQDGLAFCALIHKHRPDLLDYNILSKENRVYNTNLAFDIADTHLGIPRLLDAEDICFVSTPDPRSIMTYVAQYFHAFSSQNKAEIAGRRLRKLTEVLQYVYKMKTDYEDRAKSLLNDINLLLTQWEVKDTTDLNIQQLDDKLVAFHNLKNNKKNFLLVEKIELEHLFEDIQIRLSTYHLPSYETPVELNFSAIENAWKMLLVTEESYYKNLIESLKTTKDILCKRFLDDALYLKQALDKCKKQQPLTINLIDQLQATKNSIDYLNTLKNKLNYLRELDLTIKEANIETILYFNIEYSDIELEFKLTESCLSKKITFIENQMVLRNSNALAPEQLDEFESVFNMFDRSDKNVLTDEEFRAALESLDLSYSNDEYEELFRYLTLQNNEATITFEQYIRFLVAIFEDQNNPSQLYDSFVTVAGGKDFVTMDDFIQAGLNEEQRLALALSMPKMQNNEELMDYNQFMDNLYNE
ncbi:hypothetical protein BB561_002530 [Smittium simulii]|uniref:Actinin-like protein n=1 Tax=Smittium simulii TaxID=133385 RepID=A0A2T9YQ28_9FUNG|nr:hypothetical protein BB561_002530 [Smittium simulii]